MIYLASQSPRRRELLQTIGVAFTVLPFRAGSRVDAAIDETPLHDEPAADYVQRVAIAKATHGRVLWRSRGLPPQPVLAADTALDVDGDIIGKPADANQAFTMLCRLSARWHRVITTVAIAPTVTPDTRQSATLTTTHITAVRFRSLEHTEINRYIATGEPFDKAGAYGIQGAAAMFVERIEGSHSGVMGLPLCDTVLLLRQAGIAI